MIYVWQTFSNTASEWVNRELLYLVVEKKKKPPNLFELTSAKLAAILA